MKVVTYTHARNALKAVLDAVVRDSDAAIISRRGCVIMTPRPAPGRASSISIDIIEITALEY